MKEKINAYLLTGFIFQFGMVQPLSFLVRSQVVIAVAIFIILLIALYVNEFRIKKITVLAMLIVSLLFGTHAIIYLELTNQIISQYAEVVIKSFSALYIGSLALDDKSLIRSAKLFGLLNLSLVSVAVLIPPYYDYMNYMRFGYALLPSVLLLFLLAIWNKERRVTYTILGLATMLLMILYGSRGVISSLLLFGIILFAFYGGISSSKKIVAGVSIIILVYLDYMYHYVFKIIKFAFDGLGLHLYSVEKLLLMFSEGLARSSSGRDQLYSNVFDAISHNLIFGNGVGYTQVHLGLTTHNFILQILVETGIVGFVIWSVIGIMSTLKFRRIASKGESGHLIVLIILLSTSVGRLLVSSDLWLRTEFWLALALLFNTQVIIKTRCGE